MKFFAVVLNAYVFTTTAWAARPPSVLPQNLPAEVARAVSVSHQIVENQLRSQLDGSTSGYLVADIQVETRHSFHVYADRLQFYTEADPWLDNQEWQVEVIARPTSTRFLDPVSKTLKEGYHGQSVFRVKLSLPQAAKQAPSLDHAIPFVTYFQACTDKVCLLPVFLQTALPLASSSGPPTRSKNILSSSADMIRDALNAGAGGEALSWISIGIVLLAGLVTAFTPCVYPLYPVTLGIFARWSQAGGAAPLGLALSYCAGLTLSYASLGMLTAATGTVFGSWTQTAPFLLGVGSLILLSAVFFSGLFTFPMPQKLLHFFSRGESPEQAAARSSLSRYFQAALMGVGLGIVASPCVGPVLVALLAWIGSAQASWVKGFLLLSLFGAGMSLPFLALGHLILKMGKRPSLGRYTPVVKHFGTLLMGAASLFFLIPGFQLLKAQNSSAAETKFAIATLDTWSKKTWTVIDFRADWCAACWELERETFSSPDVSELFEKGTWEMVRVDLTQMTPENTQIAQSFKVISLPSVLIVKPGGTVCEKLSLFGFENAQDFLTRLKSAQQACSS